MAESKGIVETIVCITCPNCGEKIIPPKGKSFLMRDRLKARQYFKKHMEEKPEQHP
jgi:predicted RNA-binding Zn-ribbon protein involved in translation (DUF1610 family)